MILTEQQKQILKGTICPYCKRPTQCIHSSKWYGKDFGKFWMYICWPCKAHVKCMKKTKESLGRVAKLGLRFLWGDLKGVINKIGEYNLMKKPEVYKWLSDQMKIPREYMYIEMLGDKSCLQAIQLCEELVKNAKAHKNIS